MSLKAQDIQKIVDGIQLGISFAPQAIALVEKGKAFIQALFDEGVIEVDQLNRINDHVDAVAEAFANGKRPPAFTVEADPTAPPS